MMENKIYKNIFAIRKGGENGEKFFITLGNMLISSKLYDTEEEAIKELHEVNLESISRMMVATIAACQEMINNALKHNEHES